MGFWKARGRRCSVHVIVGAFAFVAATASSAVAVSVTLPTNAMIASVGQTTVVNVSIGAVVGIESFSVSITYTQAIANVVNNGDVALTMLGTNANCTLGPPGLLAGRVNIGVSCPFGLTGSGPLIAITFTGVSNGMTDLTFDMTPNIPNGCQFNEGTPSCEPTPGHLTVGAVGPTGTATASRTTTATATRTVPPIATNTATTTVPPSATNTVTATSTLTSAVTATITATRTSTATVTDTPTAGPSPTPSQTLTPSNTPTITQTPTASLTPSATLTTSPTGTITSTATQSATATITPPRTATATATATTVPTPLIISGAVGGSTRVSGIGARNIAAPGIEIVAENGGQVIGTGGTTETGAFFDGQPGIGLIRPLVAGERIFPRDTVNNLVGPVVTVGPQPPTAIPTMDEYGMAVLGTLLGLTLAWRLARSSRRRS